MRHDSFTCRFISLTYLSPYNKENSNQFAWSVKLLPPNPIKDILNERSIGAKTSIKRTRSRQRSKSYANELTMHSRISWSVADNITLYFQILSITFTGKECAFHGTDRRGREGDRVRNASGYTLSG